MNNILMAFKSRSIIFRSMLDVILFRSMRMNNETFIRYEYNVIMGKFG